MSLASEVTRANQISALLNCVTKATIYEGRIKDDPKFWEIHFEGLDTPIKIESELMDSPKAFRKQFLKLTDTPAPPLSASDWYTFVSELSERADRAQSLDESDNVYFAEYLFELIRELPAIKKEHVLKSKGYVSQEGFRCVHSNTIKQLTENLNIKISPQILSGTLEQLGYKEPKTRALWVNGKQHRFWFFKEECFSVLEGDSNE